MYVHPVCLEADLRGPVSFTLTALYHCSMNSMNRNGQR